MLLFIWERQANDRWVHRSNTHMIVPAVHHFSSPLLHLWKQIYLKATLDILGNIRRAHALLVKTN